MNTAVLLFVLIMSAVLHFLIQKVFIHFKRFDDFNHRSSHKTLATRTGGIGIFLTLFIISLFYYFHKVELFDYSLFIPLGIMFIVGVYDDFYNADFKLKFLLQIIVAKILIDQGYVISNYYGLFGLYEVPWLVAQITTVFVFLVVINAINFIDGIDGLAITQAIKTILLIEFFSLNNTSLFNLGILVIIILLSLYFFNFKEKRKVFLGDGGSLLLGTLIFIYALTVLKYDFAFKENLQLNKTLFSVIVLLYPLIDLIRVFSLRIFKGKSPFIADQNHIHHLLISRFSHIKSLGIIIFSELLIIYLITKSF